MSTSIDIQTQQIEICIITNKPDDDGKTILTKNILFHPSINKKRFSKYSEYPFISNMFLIDSKKLKSKKYVEKMDFFFNRKVFEDFMNESYNEDKHETRLKGLGVTEEIKDQNSKERKKIILDHNLKVMIDMFFPTAYPFINNTGNSYDRNFGNKSKDMDIVFFPKYSYIKNKSEVFTVTKAILLNDILNHPKYYDFIVMMFEYIMWANNERKTIENEVKTMNETIKKTFEMPISSNVFESLEKQRNTTQNGMKKFIIMDLLKILNNRQNMDMGYAVGEYYLCKIPSVESILKSYFKNYMLEKLEKKFEEVKHKEYKKGSAKASTQTDADNLNNKLNNEVRNPLNKMIETLNATKAEGGSIFVFLKYNEVKVVKAAEKASQVGVYENLKKQLDITNKYIINDFNKKAAGDTVYKEVLKTITGDENPDNQMYKFYNEKAKPADQYLLKKPEKSFKLNSLLISEEDQEGNEIKTKSFFDEKKNPIVMKFKRIDWTTPLDVVLNVNDTKYDGTITKKCDKFIFTIHTNANEEAKSKLLDVANTLLTNNVNEDTERVNGIYTISETELFENFIVKTTPSKPILESQDELRLQKIDKLLNTYKDFTNIRSYGSDSSSKISDSKFNTFIDNLEKQRNTIISMETFKNEYLDCCEGEKEIECVKLYVNDKNKYDERYDQFKDTVEKYKNYMSSKSENQNDILQKLIDNYGNNTNTEDSKKFVNLILDLYQKNIQQRNIEHTPTTDINNYIQLYANNINKDKPKKPNFQAHLLLNVIKGEVNDKNKHLVRCNFEDRYLNKRFYMHFINLKDQEKNKEINYPYVELKSDGTFKEVPKEEPSDEGQELDAPVEEKKKAKGGTMRIKSRKNSTFRRKKSRKNKSFRRK